MAMMVIWLAGAAHVRAAEPAGPPGKPAAATDTAVLLDEDTVWRHLHLDGPSFFLLDDPKVTAPVRRPQCVKTAAGTMAKVGFLVPGNSSRPVDWPSEATSLPPPSDWAGVTFDDSAWMLAYWPQPLPDPRLTGFSEGHIPVKEPSPFDTVVVLARSRFEIKDPTRVKACRLSLDYWGGVAVYVNGKEAARGHLPGQQPYILDRLAEAYPTDALPSSNPGAGDKRTPRDVPGSCATSKSPRLYCVPA